MPRFAWVKVAVEMPRDAKLFTRPLLDRHLWTCLLCHAQENYPNGVLEDANPAALNSLFNLGSVAKTKAALDYFAARGMIQIESDFLKLVNFQKRQEKAKESPDAVRERQQRWRDRHRNGHRDVTDNGTATVPVTGVTRNADGDEDEDREEEKDSKIHVSSQRGESERRTAQAVNCGDKSAGPLSVDVNQALAQVRAAAAKAGVGP